MQHDLNRDLMAVYETLPASLEAIVEGYDGPIDIQPEQALDATLRTVRVLQRHVPNIAGAAQLALGLVETLQGRVAELERRLGEECAGS